MLFVNNDSYGIAFSSDVRYKNIVFNASFSEFFRTFLCFYFGLLFLSLTSRGSIIVNSHGSEVQLQACRNQKFSVSHVQLRRPIHLGCICRRDTESVVWGDAENPFLIGTWCTLYFCAES